LNSSLKASVITSSGLLSLRAMSLKSSDFLAEVKSFTLIIFEMNYLKYLITDTLNVSNKFLKRVSEEEK